MSIKYDDTKDKSKSEMRERNWWKLKSGSKFSVLLAFCGNNNSWRRTHLCSLWFDFHPTDRRQPESVDVNWVEPGLRFLHSGQEDLQVVRHLYVHPGNVQRRFGTRQGPIQGIQRLCDGNHFYKLNWWIELI